MCDSLGCMPVKVIALLVTREMKEGGRARGRGRECVCVCACARVCVRACVRACVCDVKTQTPNQL